MPYQFTLADQALLESYVKLAELLGRQFGPGCEVVVHSLENLDASVIKIVNGHNTGRAEGSPATDLAVKIARDYKAAGAAPVAPYYAKHGEDTLFRSTSHVIRGEAGVPVGLFCVNMNLCVPMIDFYRFLMPDINNNTEPERFSVNPGEAIIQALRRYSAEADQDESICQKRRNKSIIRKLYEAGLFELKEAVPLVARELNLTRHAVYKNLREIKTEM